MRSNLVSPMVQITKLIWVDKNTKVWYTTVVQKNDHTFILEDGVIPSKSNMEAIAYGKF